LTSHVTNSTRPVFLPTPTQAPPLPPLPRTEAARRVSRTATRTAWPRDSSARTMERPRNPLPPITAAVREGDAIPRRIVGVVFRAFINKKIKIRRSGEAFLEKKEKKEKKNLFPDGMSHSLSPDEVDVPDRDACAMRYLRHPSPCVSARILGRVGAPSRSCTPHPTRASPARRCTA
jgi:hypothetical protein